MTNEELYVYFGSLNKAAKAIGVARTSCYAWMKRGYIPIKKQEEIETLTDGFLRASKADARLKDADYESLIYLPNFRYYSKEHGMCEVLSIFFRKGKKPKISYCKEWIEEKYTTFDTKNLMQNTGITDKNGTLLFEKDILLLKNGEKFIFEDLTLLGKVKNLRNFTIVGNIFEKAKYAKAKKTLSN